MDEQIRQLLEQLESLSDPHERMRILHKLKSIEEGRIEMRKGHSSRKSGGGGPITIAVLALLVAIGVGFYSNRVSKRIPADTDMVSESTMIALVDGKIETLFDSLSGKIAKIEDRTRSKRVFKEPKIVYVTESQRPFKKREKESPEITVVTITNLAEQGKEILPSDTTPKTDTLLTSTSDTTPKTDTLLTSTSDTTSKPDTSLVSASDTLASDTLASDTLAESGTPTPDTLFVTAPDTDAIPKSDTLTSDTLSKDKLAEDKEKKPAKPGKGVTLKVEASQDMAQIFFNRTWTKEGYRSGSDPVFKNVPPSTFRINVENDAGLWSADAASLSEGKSHFEVRVNGTVLKKIEDNGVGGANFVFTVNSDGSISQ